MSAKESDGPVACWLMSSSIFGSLLPGPAKCSTGAATCAARKWMMPQACQCRAHHIIPETLS